MLQILSMLTFGLEVTHYLVLPLELNQIAGKGQVTLFYPQKRRFLFLLDHVSVASSRNTADNSWTSLC